MQWLRKLLVLGPVVPPRLWLTGAAAGLAMLGLVFNEELWLQPRLALHWNLALLFLLLQAAGGQFLVVLWRWPATYMGPTWGWLLMRGISVLFSIGIVLLMLLSSIAVTLVVIRWPQR